jgi:hypothetical protein
LNFLLSFNRVFKNYLLFSIKNKRLQLKIKVRFK